MCAQRQTQAGWQQRLLSPIRSGHAQRTSHRVRAREHDEDPQCEGTPMKKRLAVLIAVPATLALSAGAAFAVSAGNFDATLRPVPHHHVADGGSDVNGHASLRLTGRTL